MTPVPLSEGVKHSYYQIVEKIRRFYGVEDAEQWYKQQKRAIEDGAKPDSFGITQCDSLREYWERKQLLHKWRNERMEQQGRSRETHTVEIFAVRGVGAKGELGVVTTATDLEPFILDLAAACARFASNEERKTTTQLEHDFGWIFRNAFPIAFKLSGYKADQVIERRTLMCGSNAPSPDDVVAAA